MPFKPKFIYFDLDDTLLDHKRAEENALRDTFQHFTLFGTSDVEKLIDVYHAVNSRQWELYGRSEVNREQLQRNRFELTLRQLGLDDSRFDEVGSQYMQYYQNHWSWVDGAREAFDAIRSNFEVGILTNGFSETQKKKFEQFDLYNLANHLVISEEAGYLKPQPEIFEYATELTGYTAPEILYIGDSFNSDILGGSGYGWKTAWYSSDGEEEQRIKADFVFNDFSTLCDYLKV